MPAARATPSTTSLSGRTRVPLPSAPSALLQTRKAAVGGSRAEAIEDCSRKRAGPHDASRQSTSQIDDGVLGLKRKCSLHAPSLTYGLHTNVWLRIGRPQALAIRIGAHLVGGLPGTPANLLLTRAG
jgi:hypothetical protein